METNSRDDTGELSEAGAGLFSAESLTGGDVRRG